MKNLKDLKLSVKLIILGIAVALIPMLIVGGVSVRTALNALKASCRESTLRISRDLAMASDLFLTEEIKFARQMALSRGIARLITLNREGSPDDTLAAALDMDRYFSRIYEEIGKDYDLFFVADDTGAILSDSMAGALRTKQVNVGDRAYFKAARAGEINIGPPIKSRASGKAVVVIAVPLKTGTGTFEGVFCSVLTLDALSEKFASIRFGKTGYAYMLNKEGIALAHPNKEYRMALDFKTVKGMETIVRRMLAGESGVEPYLFEAKQKLAGFAPVTRTGWSIGVTINHDELMAPVRRMSLYSVAAGILVLLGVTGVVLFSARYLIAPINGAVAGLKDIAQGQGDLARRLPVAGGDEIGVLSRSFNAFMDKLQAMISDISTGVGTLSHSSSGLKEISEKMSAGAGRTSEKAGIVSGAARDMTGNMTAVSEAMDESSLNINAVAGAAEQMNATIDEIARNAEKAREISGTAVEKVEASTGEMGELGSAAQSIGQVVEAINDISEQVNLLSLNATIEAARAGDAGKGFAVVANEIKDLAHQTSRASMDIKEKIDHIQKSSASALSGMGDISKVIADVDAIVSSIAAAVEEQSASTREIADNIARASSGILAINDKISKTSGTAQEITKEINEVNSDSGVMADQGRQVQASAKSLSELAGRLDEMVGRFRV